MFAEIKIVIEVTEKGKSILDVASGLALKAKKGVNPEFIAVDAVDKINEDFEALLWTIEELVDNFDGTLVTVRMGE